MKDIDCIGAVQVNEEMADITKTKCTKPVKSANNSASFMEKDGEVLTY